MTINKKNTFTKKPSRDGNKPSYPKVTRRRFFEILGCGTAVSWSLGCGNNSAKEKKPKTDTAEKVSAPQHTLPQSRVDDGPDLSLPGGENSQVKEKLESRQLKVQSVKLKDGTMLSYVLLFSFNNLDARALVKEKRNKILFTADNYLKNNCIMDSVSSLESLATLNATLKPSILEILASAPPSYFALKMVRVHSTRRTPGKPAL